MIFFIAYSDFVDSHVAFVAACNVTDKQWVLAQIIKLAENVSYLYNEETWLTGLDWELYKE